MLTVLVAIITASILTLNSNDTNGCEEITVPNYSTVFESLPEKGRILFEDEGVRYFFLNVCKDYNMDPCLILALIEEESSYRTKIVNRLGCSGLMQISPKNHLDRMARLGVTDLLTAKDNILTGVDYLSELMESNETAESLMIYNQGWSGKDDYAEGIISKYAQSILDRQKELREYITYETIQIMAA